MAKHILTEEDLQNNPFLREKGFKSGEEIEIPENQNLTDEETDPPGGIEVPKKPPPAP